MPFEYVSVEDAIPRHGVRMVVVGDVPSSWGEAAKGILYVKGIEWVAVRLVYDSEPLREWAGQRNGPVLVYENERPRSGWAEFCSSRSALRPALRCFPQTRPTAPWFSGSRTKSAASRGLGGRGVSSWCTLVFRMPAAFPDPFPNISPGNTATAPKPALLPHDASPNCSAC